ncbi:hypothetical protein [Micromonospora sp. MA102]|uniref:hypothetical protein n=1 Tax=Micromonospora sp. MA102 TaxID=2952755 RepID=UPI0021C5FCBA|nr:hypothetical protein [Micromonospora sp. MA102]
MSRELTRLYGALAVDTDERVLPAPDRVRRRADRRARQRAAMGALAVAALVAGTVAGAQLVLAAGPDAEPAPATPTDSPSPSATPTPPSPLPSHTSPAPSARTPEAPPKTSARPPDPGPTSIPDRAFFTLAAANDTGIGDHFIPGPVLPALCGARPGEAGTVTRRARSVPFKLTGTPKGYVPDGSYRHSITVYRPGRADDALAELREAVRDCPEQPVPDTSGVTQRQRLLGDTGYGDESVLFETRTLSRDVNGDPTGGDEVHLVRAIRSGDVVTVVWEQGWEGTSTERARFDADSRRAVEAIRRWLA